MPPFENKSDNCFAINGDIFNPECHGVKGIVEAYKTAVYNVLLAGPTHFAPIISLVNEMTETM